MEHSGKDKIHDLKNATKRIFFLHLLGMTLKTKSGTCLRVSSTQSETYVRPPLPPRHRSYTQLFTNADRSARPTADQNIQTPKSTRVLSRRHRQQHPSPSFPCWHPPGTTRASDLPAQSTSRLWSSEPTPPPPDTPFRYRYTYRASDLLAQKKYIAIAVEREPTLPITSLPFPGYVNSSPLLRMCP